jgi:F420-dependent oxidoreductase-like protein
MRLRVLLEARHGVTYDQLLALARTAEEVGFDAFFVSDHYLGIEPDNARLEPTDSWTTLAGLARDTQRIRLGTLVTPVTFRLPSVLAITVATVDAMSAGRVELGLGTGWHQREHEAYGIPFPERGERFDRLEEQLKIITGLWTTPPGERFSFRGSYYAIEDAANFPRTAQSPRPTLIVGGGGPRRTPRLASRFADEYNCGFPSGAGERFARFGEVCEQTGRDPATVRLSVCLPVCCGRDESEVSSRVEASGARRLLEQGVCGPPEAVVHRLEALGEEGAGTVYLHLYDVADTEHLRLLGDEVVRQLA